MVKEELHWTKFEHFLGAISKLPTFLCTNNISILMHIAWEVIKISVAQVIFKLLIKTCQIWLNID